MKRITLIGPVIPWDGYGNLLNTLVVALPAVGYETEVISTWEVHKQRTPREVLAKLITLDDKKAAYSLYCCDMTGHPTDYETDKKLHFTMWEASRLKRLFVDKLNTNLAVIVPCKWNKQIFESAKVHSPVCVVNLGIDIEKYVYRAPEADGPFVFGAGGNVGLGGGKRKQLQEIVKLFTRAFQGVRDVRLTLKTDVEHPRYTDPRVRVIREYLTEEQMIDWYASFHIFLSVSSGEGWSFMPQKAMAVGRPVVMPAYGGVTEYFDDTVGYPLEFDLGAAQGYYASTEGQWAYFKPDALVERMRWAYQNREQLLAIGRVASERARQFSIQAMISQLKQVLDYFVK